MPQDQIEASYFSPDILEFIKLLHAHEVRYVGLANLVRNKEACARAKDQEDLKFLRQLQP
jgi:hypothetical protein